jgi:aurora kinase, other
MATIGSVTRQIAALEISTKQNGATKQTRPLNHQKSTSQSNVSKLLTKFAAPNPFPDPKVKASVRTIPPRSANTAHSTAKQPQPAPQKPQPAPASQPKTTTDRGLDIGKYDGGFEIENEKRGETVDGEAARDLALDSSVSRLVCSPPASLQVFTRPHKNTPNTRMASYRL